MAMETQYHPICTFGAPSLIGNKEAVKRKALEESYPE